MPLTLDELMSHSNLAETLDEKEQYAIADEVLQFVEYDEQSMDGWLQDSKEALELAAQVRGPKSSPWPNASNTKYPLLTIASTQFHARAQQSLVNETGMVQAKVVGRDPQGLKKARGMRVGAYMTHQLTEQMDNWIDDTDRLLLLLPICGMAFRKVYYSARWTRPHAELVLPQDLIMSYYAKDFQSARKTHILEVNRNEVVEMVRDGFYLDIDYGSPDREAYKNRHSTDDIQKLRPSAHDDDVPYTMLECHTWYDLDGDGYAEPYIITVCKDSGKLARITRRFREDDIQVNEKGEIVRIEPREHFIKYIFTPDPQSALFGIGLGTLLGPLNRSVNTIINQLTDAGTLSVLQSGFLGRGIKAPVGGVMRFKPGEWKTFQTAGDDLRKNVFPLPVKEPSAVLFQLLGLLIKSGENAGSIADIMLGENPGQNQPYSTTLAVIEQGQKVFVAIYKRLYRSLKKEYKHLFTLNGLYLDEAAYINVVDDPAATMDDWNGEGEDIVPASDPNSVSDLQKLKKAEGIMALAAQGLVNSQVATRRFLEALGEQDVDELLEMPPPQPNPEQQLEQARLAIEEQTSQMEMFKDFTQGMKNMAAAKKEEAETELLPGEAELKQMEGLMDVYVGMRKQGADEDGAAEERQIKREDLAAKRSSNNSGSTQQ